MAKFAIQADGDLLTKQEVFDLPLPDSTIALFDSRADCRDAIRLILDRNPIYQSYATVIFTDE